MDEYQNMLNKRSLTQMVYGVIEMRIAAAFETGS